MSVDKDSKQKKEAALNPRVYVKHGQSKGYGKDVIKKKLGQHIAQLQKKERTNIIAHKRNQVKKKASIPFPSFQNDDLDGLITGMQIAGLEDSDEERPEGKGKPSYETLDKKDVELIEFGKLSIEELLEFLHLFSIPVTVSNMSQQGIRIVHALVHLCSATDPSVRSDHEDVTRSLIKTRLFQTLEYQLPNIMAINAEKELSKVHLPTELYNEHKQVVASLVVILTRQCLKQIVQEEVKATKQVVRLIESLFYINCMNDEDWIIAIWILHRVLTDGCKREDSFFALAGTPRAFALSILSLIRPQVAIFGSETHFKEKQVRALELAKALSSSTHPTTVPLLVECTLITKMEQILTQEAYRTELVEPCLFILSNVVSGTSHNALLVAANDDLMKLLLEIGTRNSSSIEIIWVLAKLASRFDDDLFLQAILPDRVAKMMELLTLVLSRPFEWLYENHMLTRTVLHAIKTAVRQGISIDKHHRLWSKLIHEYSQKTDIKQVDGFQMDEDTQVVASFPPTGRPTAKSFVGTVLTEIRVIQSKIPDR